MNYTPYFFRRNHGRMRLMITCPPPSPLDLGRSSKFAILSSVSSSTVHAAHDDSPITKWQRAQVIPRSSSAMPCDETETVEHAYARHTLPHGPSPSATSTPRRLHTHAPSPTHLPRAALPRACQMSRCSTGRRLMRTQLVRRLAAGARARSANGIDARARSANGIDAERVARRRRWRRCPLSQVM